MKHTHTEYWCAFNKLVFQCSLLDQADHTIPVDTGGGHRPQMTDKIFSSAKKFLGQIDQLLRLCKCKKTQLQGAFPLTGALPLDTTAPTPRYRFALYTHRMVTQIPTLDLLVPTKVSLETLIRTAGVRLILHVTLSS